MKNDIYEVYIKGLENGGLVAAYAVYYKGIAVHHAAKKCYYTFFLGNGNTCEIAKSRGHFFMEVYAAYAGLEYVPAGSRVVIKTNNVSCLGWLNGNEPSEHYLPIWTRFMEVQGRKHLQVTCEWAKKGSCNETDFVSSIAVSAQKK